MDRIGIVVAVFATTVLVGCVPSYQHNKVLADLQDANIRAAEVSAAFDNYKNKSTADMEALRQSKAKATKELTAALTEARDRVTDLEGKLATEQVKAATLREEKQKLMSGTTTAQEEIARIQKRVGELETAASRVDDLEKRIRERDQEIAKLQAGLVDREKLVTKVATLTEERAKLMNEIQQQRDAIRARNAQPDMKDCVSDAASPKADPKGN